MLNANSVTHIVSMIGNHEMAPPKAALVNVSFNELDQEMLTEADGYEDSSMGSASSPYAMNLAFKAGFVYDRLFFEYAYLGDTNKASNRAVNVSSLTIGLIF